ncbi:hypothetical protein D1007_11782 [Hordeum vulgare]|nr:hypothetical protein D1007_11782 [Hordeum vulgare]
MIDASNAYSQPPISKESEVELYAPTACSQPPTSQANEVDVTVSENVIQKDGDGDAHGDLDEVEEGFHGIDVGDLDAYMAQKEMDHELPFRRLYGYDSDDGDLEEELDEDGFTKEENQIHFELTGLEKRTHLFRDLSLAHKAIVDGGMRNTAIEPTPCPDPGLVSDYAIQNHRPFFVKHSDINLRYSMKCEKEMKDAHGRPPKKCDRTTHHQLTCEYLRYKFMRDIVVDPTVKVRFLMRTAKKLYGYELMYGKAWRAKANAIRMLYGSYEEVYNQLPRLLGAIAHRNPGMYHVVDDNHGVFHHAFWSYEQCVEAFKHCCPVLSVDGSFLTDRYKGNCQLSTNGTSALMVAMAHSLNDNVLPVAFALVPSEHQENWEWFMGHARHKVIVDREVCIISDRHHGMLKAVDIVIPGFPKLHHIWCMRHFVANFYRACKSKKFSKDLNHVCVAFTIQAFDARYNKLFAAVNDRGK